MEHYTNIFACQGPLSKAEKWSIAIIITVLVLSSTYYFLTADKRAAQEAIIIDNFSTAASELITFGLNLTAPKIFKNDESRAKQLQNNYWHVTSNIHSDKYHEYYYGFQIIRTVKNSGWVNWFCVPQYHPVNKKLYPNNINFSNYYVEISDEDLKKWPNTRPSTLLRQQDRKNFVDLLKKVQQQTAHLFK